jgi:hypothetical protein
MYSNHLYNPQRKNEEETGEHSSLFPVKYVISIESVISYLKSTESSAMHTSRALYAHFQVHLSPSPGLHQ